ncbi:zinc finger CCCH domain-containing protein 17 [Argentina anserina]|uniref:zinc finger CCCH domain-containing protein 17 n=1 Tax=Argentina anserina TaxID=57926 RepID=UPI0021767477|nr:zinc finger CCCH domain-containing protein 17 [Potentilla anserina]
MVVGAQQKPQPQSQPQQQQQPPQQQQPEPSPEEEALKRNTDCVYFLASPVSCKKGSECEYRHSEHALYNPRDCWFWLNGNCLNLKCSFRHPPLDGLLGSPAANSAGPSLPLPHTVTTPAATFSSSKQAVPCIFFQRGFCSKADKCPFSHGPNPIFTSKAPQAPAATHGTEPSSLKKVFGGIQKCTQEMKFPQVSASKVVGVAPQPKPAPEVETAPPRNGVGIDRNVRPSRDFDDEALTYETRSAFPAMNGDSTGQGNHFLQAHVPENHGFQNGKDVDEHLRESSPGFDVLVDDELGDSDYYHGEEQFGRTRVHDGRNLNSMNEYDLDRPADYNSVADGDRERFHDPRGYDPYDQMQGRYAWEQHRASSERLLVGPAHSERRGHRKSDSPDHMDGSDLRHRLSKHRGGNGLRSIISNDYDGRVNERKNRPHRDSQQLPLHESSLSSRLRGRIKLPVGTSPVNGSDLRQEREAGGRSRDRSRDRMSPRRPQSMSHQGRLRDRIQGRVQDDSNNEGRHFGPPRIRREVMDEGGNEFSRSKRPSELKGAIDAEIREHSYLGKPSNVNTDKNQQSEGELSFEGPKPLSEILKRKREAEAAAGSSGSRKKFSVDKLGNSVKESPVTDPGGFGTGAVSGTLDSQPPVAKEESKSATIDAVGIQNEKIDTAPGQPSNEQSEGEQETEDGVIYDETPEDHDLEAKDNREGEYDYEQGEDGEYTYEEGENADGEEEYPEEEDGDDFAKKIGVMFS